MKRKILVEKQSQAKIKFDWSIYLIDQFIWNSILSIIKFYQMLAYFQMIKNKQNFSKIIWNSEYFWIISFKAVQQISICSNKYSNI